VEITLPARTAPTRSAAIIGAGDFIGSAIAKRFAAEGYAVFAGRRTAEKLAPLKDAIEAAGGVCVARGLDARKEEDIAAFLQEAEAHAPLEVVIFNPGANVNFPILEMTERVFRKVWEMACLGGFLTGREAARLMLPRERGSIFFTGATASLRGGSGYAAFASAKAGLRMVAQSMARELGPQGLHVAHLIIDAGVDTAFVRERLKTRIGEEALRDLPPDTLMNPTSVAEAYWYLHTQAEWEGETWMADTRPAMTQGVLVVRNKQAISTGRTHHAR
jgi:NAD(P)-dependent dehydrogenase (short-subunit alcohol dehydrogenase family)